MHLTPGRGIWCFDQSNTNTGHDIPSGPLDAPEHCCREPEPPGGLPKLRNFDPRRLWPTAWTAGYDLACGGGTTPISSTPWGLTRHAIPGFAYA
jgi:hypothetical protein